MVNEGKKEKGKNLQRTKTEQRKHEEKNYGHDDSNTSLLNGEKAKWRKITTQLWLINFSG